MVREASLTFLALKITLMSSPMNVSVLEETVNATSFVELLLDEKEEHNIKKNIYILPNEIQ